MSKAKKKGGKREGGTYSVEKFKQLMIYKRRMIRKQTKHERLFFEILKKFYGKWAIKKKVKRQKIFVRGKCGYIADFYIKDLKLVFEIDGDSHKIQQEYDERRTSFINTYGVKVVRFSNKEVEQAGMAGKIFEQLRRRGMELQERVKRENKIVHYISSERKTVSHEAIESATERFLAEGGKIRRLG